ncbi:MAG: hypothetical protein JSR21_00870 [Proteobacteria bacterium]|nr:hypothetical protein [Pseudomonadota bacterium]
MAYDSDPREEAGNDLQSLLLHVRDLRDSVKLEGRALHRSWKPHLKRAEATASMLNFAHYLALRSRDLRPLQDQLARLGLSSLGRAEGHVLASLDAVTGALARLASAPDQTPWPPPARHFMRGANRLEANAAGLFGPPRRRGTTRIMTTLPTEAATEPGYVRSLIQRGADIVRINCAHDTPDDWIAMASNAREAAHMCGRYVPVLMDIAGPKLRTAATRHPKGDKRLEVGDTLALVASEAALDAGEPGFAAVVEPGVILLRLKPGSRVAIDDGVVEGVVQRRRADGSVEVQVHRAPEDGYKLKTDKGLNFPEIALGLEPLSPQDLSDLDVIAAHADLVGHSFVNSADDVAALQEALAARRSGARQLGVIAKIETQPAIANLPEIIVQAAGAQPFGVMIARGDLAVEIGFPRVAEMQEEVLWACEAAHVPVIWATQVLESMVKTGLPTRGEMTDAAMSARAECVMLNKGPHIAEAIEMLDSLLGRMSEHQVKKSPRLRALQSWRRHPGARHRASGPGSPSGQTFNR